MVAMPHAFHPPTPPERAMIKLTFCLRRQAHLTREEFQEYWLNTHGPLIQSHAKAMNVRRYVQLHTANDPMNDFLRKTRGTLEPFDGLAELWWDSREDFEAAFTTPEGKAAGREILEDEKKFLDTARSAVWIGEEHVLVGD